jgi:hypothetical protein
MGGVRARFPLGSFTEVPRPSGVVSGASFEITAPVGTVNRGSGPPRMGTLRRPISLTAALGAPEGLAFWLSGHRYRLRPSDFKAPPTLKDDPIRAGQALGIVERAARQNADNPALAHLLEEAAEQLASGGGGARLLLFETAHIGLSRRRRHVELLARGKGRESAASACRERRQGEADDDAHASGGAGQLRHGAHGDAWSGVSHGYKPCRSGSDADERRATGQERDDAAQGC